MALTKQQVRDLYTRRAKRYDFTANLYYLVGFREWRIRAQAIRALGLRPGDTVVEIGCGTGLNFSLLQQAIGRSGRLIGVDMTDSMLQQAFRRVTRKGWDNVDLVRCDAAEYVFPKGVNGILSTFALTLVPEFDEVIQRGARALAGGGRWVVADFKLPESSSTWLLPLLLPATRPFGVTVDLAERQPWESLERHLGNLVMHETYFGYAYVAMSRKTAGAAQT